MWQLLALLVGASVAYSIKGTPQAAIAVLSGGGISVLNGALLTWRISRAALSPVHDAHHQLRLMYLYTVERFMVVIALLGLCLAALKLTPLAVVSGFITGQAVLMATRIFLNKFKD